MTAALDRRDGFHAELHARGLRGHGSADGDFSVDGGRRAMEELLATDPRIDAVFAANDLMAFGAFQALAERGRHVPDDIAIVGFDDAPLAAPCGPALTTVRQPVVEMGDGAGHPAADAPSRTATGRPGTTDHADRTGPARHRVIPPAPHNSSAQIQRWSVSPLA